MLVYITHSTTEYNHNTLQQNKEKTTKLKGCDKTQSHIKKNILKKRGNKRKIPQQNRHLRIATVTIILNGNEGFSPNSRKTKTFTFTTC